MHFSQIISFALLSSLAACSSFDYAPLSPRHDVAGYRRGPEPSWEDDVTQTSYRRSLAPQLRRDAFAEAYPNADAEAEAAAEAVAAAEAEAYAKASAKAFAVADANDDLAGMIAVLRARDFYTSPRSLLAGRSPDRPARKDGGCTSVAACKCPGNLGSCMNGKCLCGDANAGVAKITNAIAKPIAEGLKKAGAEIQKVVGGLEFAVKMALKISSWAIPGLGKAAVKALSDAIPLTGTGDKKADEIMAIINKVM